MSRLYGDSDKTLTGVMQNESSNSANSGVYASATFTKNKGVDNWQFLEN